MKNFKFILFVVFTILFFQSMSAQDWIEKQFDYDSIMNVNYGSSLNYNGTEVDLHLNLYLPNCPIDSLDSKKPLAIFIHGGAFLEGSKDENNITMHCRNFVKRGYVTASIDYRLGMISDEKVWNCNYPKYSCLFATDEAEWYRALFRSIQDTKGAIRYLVNRSEDYNIDVNNIFLVGESAGSLTALGAGLMDVESEKFDQANAIDEAPKPGSNTNDCEHQSDETFPNNTIARPDLGSIDGDIEPSSTDYTIKGIGNFYGAMMTDLLKEHNPQKVKPAIYSFHQPCDIIVTIDSAAVFWGLTWCFTNGYNCSAIDNTPTIYGSRIISNWNTDNNYGYTIQDEFTNKVFPYSFLFGDGSCVDQANNPCHNYDNFNLRETELAEFFEPFISSTPLCNTPTAIEDERLSTKVKIFPNPFNTDTQIEWNGYSSTPYTIYNAYGVIIKSGYLDNGINRLTLDDVKSSLLYVVIHAAAGPICSKIVAL